MKAAFLAASAAMLMAGSAQASTTIGGFTFTSSATSLIQASGAWISSTGAPLATAVTDSDLISSVFSFDPNAFLRIGFANGILNGAGNDFVVFTIGNFAPGIADPVPVTINGVTIVLPPSPTTSFVFGPGRGQLNAAAFDLTDFGLASGASISEIRISGSTSPLAPIMPFFGVLNTGTGAVVPEPSTWMLMIMGFGLIAQQLRRRHRGVAQVAA